MAKRIDYKKYIRRKFVLWDETFTINECFQHWDGGRWCFRCTASSAVFPRTFQAHSLLNKYNPQWIPDKFDQYKANLLKE